MKRVFKILTRNFPFKLVSVFIAVVIWYMVVYNNDPIQTNSYQVKIKVENEAYIANGKQQFVIDESYKTVTVYIKGNMSKLRKVTEDDISVVADLTQIVDLNREPVVVPLSVSCDGFDATAISLSRNTIPIVIENVESKELIITASAGDTVPSKEYEVGKLTASPSSITIYGPESVINSIDSVVAEVNITGLNHDGERAGTLVFIDKNQDRISDVIIENDITFDGGEPEVAVSVELWKKQSDVSIDVNYVGEPAAGYMVSSLFTTPEKITVAGTDEALKKLALANNKISIPADQIDVTGLYEDDQVEINIIDYLPEGLKLSSSTNNTIIATVVILPIGSSEYALDVDEIEVKNLDPTLAVSYDKQEIILRINGSLLDIYNINSETIKASIDLKSYKVGDYTVPINVELPSGCELIEDASISIHIKQVTDKDN